MPKVSVIIPVYNCERYISRCVDSVLGQTFGDFELVLVDDGSKDGSGKICDEYACSDDRVKVIHKQNAGVSAARNTGIDNATGTFITFIDSDDYVAEDMLLKMLERAQGTDLLITSLEMICKDGKHLYKMKEGDYSPAEIIKAYCNEDFPRICVCGPCCKLFKREIIAENSIYFDPDMRLGEDTCFNMKYITCCKKITGMKERFYFYMRENENSLFSKFREYFYNDIKKVYEYSAGAAEYAGCGRECIEKLKKICVASLTSNIGAAVSAVGKKETIAYIRKLGRDSVICECDLSFEKTLFRKFTLVLIKMHMYSAVYYMWRIKKNIHR